jgi:hypothetical protein
MLTLLLMMLLILLLTFEYVQVVEQVVSHLNRYSDAASAKKKRVVQSPTRLAEKIIEPCIYSYTHVTNECHNIVTHSVVSVPSHKRLLHARTLSLGTVGICVQECCTHRDTVRARMYNCTSSVSTIAQASTAT